MYLPEFDFETDGLIHNMADNTNNKLALHPSKKNSIR